MDEIRTAVVTGASSGIGAMIYSRLQKMTGRYDRVVGISRRGPDLSFDLGIMNTHDYNTIKGQLLGDEDEISLLVNCAGIMPLKEAGHEQHIFDVNFWGTYKITMALLPKLIEAKGCVINIASVSGMVAEPDEVIYAVSKAAVISLTKSLAVKLAPSVRVNCISPGFFDTNLVEGPAPPDLIETVPMRYEADVEELWPVALSIISSGYMTGANIVVDGGLSCKAS